MAGQSSITVENILALPAEQAARLAGISAGQLRRWEDRHIVEPGIVTRLSSRRTVRLYEFHDLLALLVAAELRMRRNVPLQQIAKVVAHLRSRAYTRPLAELKFAIGGGEIYFMHPDGSWEGGRRPDQVVIHQVIDLEPLRARIVASRERSPEDVGKIERRRGVLGGKPVIAGTRVPVAMVRSCLARGLSADDVLTAYPTLAPEDVEAVRSAS